MGQHLDVLVVGAGISGIGAGYFLSKRCPDHRFLIVEQRPDLGGTWDLFRYPGVRSDSDMHTLGYSFRPWKAEKSIADGPAILAYLNDTVDEFALRDKVQFNTTVTSAEWSSADARWTVELTTGGDQRSTITCGYLFVCAGYYRYDRGYTPEFAGRERFAGPIVHPQHWPHDLDVDGKRVVIIGSGATAVTLVPALADQGAQVTMLQRSPSYVVARPSIDPVNAKLRRRLPESLAYRITRWKNIRYQQLVYRRTRSNPAEVRQRLLAGVRAALGPDFDVDTHFTPRYDPWDQRLCLVPDGDLFKALRKGAATAATDSIVSFTETGIELASGAHLDADIIVTATGFEMLTLGGISCVVDGQPIDFSKTWSYKGFAYSGVPNLGSSFGYVNASWTLRSDLIAQYLCRMLVHMRRTGTTICVPQLRPSDYGMRPRPWIDHFSAGYLQRGLVALPMQGDRQPWLNPQDYVVDRRMFAKDPVDDGVMHFGVTA